MRGVCFSHSLIQLCYLSLPIKAQNLTPDEQLELLLLKDCGSYLRWFCFPHPEKLPFFIQHNRKTRRRHKHRAVFVNTLFLCFPQILENAPGVGREKGEHPSSTSHLLEVPILVERIFRCRSPHHTSACRNAATLWCESQHLFLMGSQEMTQMFSLVNKRVTHLGIGSVCLEAGAVGNLELVLLSSCRWCCGWKQLE